MPKRIPEELHYICLPEDDDLNHESIEEITDSKIFSKLKFNAKDYNADSEYIFNQKVYPDTKQNLNKRIKKELQKSNDKEVDSSKINIPKEQDMELDPNLKIVNSDTLEVTTGLKLKRKIIGFITSGGFSMNRGYGIGKGCVVKNSIDFSKDNQYVLVRNPSSTLYFKAKIEKVY